MLDVMPWLCATRKSAVGLGYASPISISQSAQTIHDVAFLLDFQAKALAYILYKKPPEAKYRSFTIAKRTGGIREINAPSEDLMLLQTKLQSCFKIVHKS